MLSQECRDQCEAKMRKQMYSEFYLKLSELTQKLYTFRSIFYNRPGSNMSTDHNVFVPKKLGRKKPSSIYLRL